MPYPQLQSILGEIGGLILITLNEKLLDQTKLVKSAKFNQVLQNLF
jgi:hypothetical protein